MLAPEVARSKTEEAVRVRAETILALYLHGYTPAEVARMTGVGRRTVKRYLGRIGLGIQNGGRYDLSADLRAANP